MTEKNELGKQLLGEFERTIGMAKLRALSNLSLERPLTDDEHSEMTRLAKQYLPL